MKVNKKEFIENFVNICEDEYYHLSANEKRKITALVEENISCFLVDKYDVGRVNAGSASVKLSVEKYISQRPYRCALPHKIEIEKQVAELLNAGLVSESSSPFTAPVTLAYKKGEGKTRLCVDFRELNKLVFPEAQPFPRIEGMLIKCYDCSY